jgi:hypothetical protein
LTSRKGSGLSRPNFYLDGADLRRGCRLRRLEMQFERFLEIRERFLFGRSLAGDVDFEALGHVPIALAPDCGASCAHYFIAAKGVLGHEFTRIRSFVDSCSFVAKILIDQPAPQREADEFAGAVEI